MIGLRSLFFGALGTGAFVLVGCAAADETGDAPTCVGELCMEAYRGLYTTEPCPDDSARSCTYVNVFFVLNEGERPVRELEPSQATMRINDREVMVDGEPVLTQDNGLLVTLLLDRSYAVTEAGATQRVREAAKAFLDNLPGDAMISIATFASEPVVPVMLNGEQGESTTSGAAFSLTDQRATLDGIIDSAYRPYEAPSSIASSKLYDAVGGLSEYGPTSGELQALQAVNVVFTVGPDVASTAHPSPTVARDYVDANAPELKVYAIALGSDVDAAALETLSDGRDYLAAGADDLEPVFETVADDLASIYKYRVLVGEQEPDASAEFVVEFGGERLTTTFELGSLELANGQLRPDAAMACGSDCSSDVDCVDGAVCQETFEGFKCLPRECADCFTRGYSCSSFADTCSFDSCI